MTRFEDLIVDVKDHVKNNFLHGDLLDNKDYRIIAAEYENRLKEYEIYDEFFGLDKLNGYIYEILNEKRKQYKKENEDVFENTSVKDWLMIKALYGMYEYMYETSIPDYETIKFFYEHGIKQLSASKLLKTLNIYSADDLQKYFILITIDDFV